MPSVVPPTASSSSALSRWNSISPWTRQLSLQILQVTSLSITFTLAYEPSSSLLPNPNLPTTNTPSSSSSSTFNPAARITATTALTPHNSKSSRGRRRKQNRKAAQHVPSTHSNQVSSASEGEDGGDEDSTTAVESDHVLSGQGMTHLLPQRREEGEGSARAGGARPHFATLLSRGLAVTVNGSPWRSVAAHVGEGVDEAVVVVYGLSPGREYNVELGLVGDDDGKAQGDINSGSTTTTIPSLSQPDGPPSPHSLNTTSTAISTSSTRSRSRANSLRSRSRANSSSSTHHPTITVPPPLPPSPAPPASSSSPLPSPSIATVPAAPIPPAARTSSPAAPKQQPRPALTAESLTILLQHRLSQSESQHATLSADLKAHRRTSQKNESHLRTTISTFQKTLDKSSAGDLRARQKVLALGESVKRLIGGKEEVKVLEGEVWEELGELEKEEERWKLEWEKVRRESEEVERKREEVVGGNEKLTAEWEAELGGLVGKLEKLTVKHDRLTQQIGTLNDHLNSIAKERDDLSNGSHPILQEAAANAVHSQGGSRQQYYDGQRFDHESAYPHHYGQGPYPPGAYKGRPPQMAPPGRGGYGGVVPPGLRQQQQQQQQQQQLQQQQLQQLQHRQFVAPRPVQTSTSTSQSSPQYQTPVPSPTTSGTQAQSQSSPSPAFRPHTYQSHHFHRPSPPFTQQSSSQPSSSSSAGGTQPSFSPFGDLPSTSPTSSPPTNNSHRIGSNPSASPFSPSFANATPIGLGSGPYSSNPPSRSGSLSNPSSSTSPFASHPSPSPPPPLSNHSSSSNIHNSNSNNQGGTQSPLALNYPGHATSSPGGTTTTREREREDDGFPPLSPTASRHNSGSWENGNGKGLVEQAVAVPLPLSPTVGEGSRY